MKLVDIAAVEIPIVDIPTISSNIFFLPYNSDNLPATGVITAPVIKNDASIQEDVLYDILIPQD